MLNPPGSVSINGYTSYPSAFVVITADGVFSKHYYAGKQRIVSRIGTESASQFNTGEECETCKQQETKNNFDDKKLKSLQKADLQFYADQLKKGTINYKEYKEIPLAEQEKALQEELVTSGADTPPLEGLEVVSDKKPFNPPAEYVTAIYYYHPDHLGTSSALTDYFSNAYQIEDSSNTNENKHVVR